MGTDETEVISEADTNQLQPADTLDDRGVADVLDEGFTTREGWSAGQGFGNTAAEQLRGETLDQRLAQEEPEIDADDSWTDPDDEAEVGDARAGRIFMPEAGSAFDVGIDGAGATAEEAAVHVIPDVDF